MASHLVLRMASPEDAAALRAIYAPYVLNTAVTFEYTAPDTAEFRARIERTLKRYPYLVAERGGEIAGYAYLSPFKARAAYDWGAETSIYLREDARRQGVGRKLYHALARIAAEQGICSLYACVASIDRADEYLTRDSILFHESQGFRPVGLFRRCGLKFDRWYDMLWMEKELAAHRGVPAAIRACSALEGLSRLLAEETQGD